MIRSLALIFVSMVGSVALYAQPLNPMIQFRGTSMPGPLVINNGGRVFVQLINGPIASPTLTFFDVKELLREAVPYTSLQGFGPFTGVDVDNNGSLDLATTLGTIQPTMRRNVFTISQSELDLVLTNVITQGAAPNEVLFADVDGDGIDDCVSPVDGQLKISYGSETAPLSEFSVALIQEGLSAQPLDQAILFGLLDGRFCVLKQVFEQIPGETFVYLQLDEFSMDSLQARADTLVRTSTLVKVDGFSLDNAVLFRGERHWHIWLPEGNQDVHVWPDGIQVFDADPTFSNARSELFSAGEILGSIRASYTMAGVVDLTKNFLAVTPPIPGSPGSRMDLGVYEVLDEASMRVRRVRSFWLDSSNANTTASIACAIVPDVGSDGLEDVIVSYVMGQSAEVDMFNICLSEGFVNSVEDGLSKRARVLATPDGWLIEGLEVLNTTSASLYDVQGRRTDVQINVSGQTLSIQSPFPDYRGLVIALINGVAVRLQ